MSWLGPRRGFGDCEVRARRSSDRAWQNNTTCLFRGTSRAPARPLHFSPSSRAWSIEH